MKIYAIRHGHTNMNKQHLYNGHIDEDINEEGIKDAEKAREKMKDMKFDIIYCSPLMRTVQTANAINEYHNLKIVKNNPKKDPLP